MEEPIPLRTRFGIYLKNINRSRLIFSLVGVTSLITLLGIIITLIINNDPSEGKNFCKKFNPYCSDGNVHTMCKFPTMKPGDACGRLDRYELSKTNIDEILNAHNEFRKIVASGNETRGKDGPQPPGNIPPLKWDNVLAIIAQRWVIQCTAEHDKCRRIDRFPCGQNLAQIGYTNGYQTFLYNIVKMWYDEVEFYNSRDVRKFKSAGKTENPTGHYTQLVWGKTTHVGCGIAQYYHKKSYRTLLVCNYNPAGNMIGQPVYESHPGQLQVVQLDSVVKILSHPHP